MLVKGSTAIVGSRGPLRHAMAAGGARGAAVPAPIGDLTHLTHKANALARKRPDQALFRAGVADCGARRIQPAAEGRLGDDAAVPHGVQQVVTADDPIARLDQEREHVEDLRLDRDQVVTHDATPAGRYRGCSLQIGRSYATDNRDGMQP